MKAIFQKLFLDFSLWNDEKFENRCSIIINHLFQVMLIIISISCFYPSGSQNKDPGGPVNADVTNSSISINKNRFKWHFSTIEGFYCRISGILLSRAMILECQKWLCLTKRCPIICPMIQMHLYFRVSSSSNIYFGPSILIPSFHIHIHIPNLNAEDTY